eukprot:gnl/MRDRNA2_/MRDRNA2_359442_c0_seq1.p1 gnl/MRDRNA2_/MRDRNA2_359442_c0~~gnl/MRDRNA2_/MRDRNA2_359442_c0_seq1.p1  ORF type:complete len:424 (-),score=48.57 gnl/MRDRNA2_/MRDRNA2_359442_c0_seq1:137-1276(-)
MTVALFTPVFSANPMFALVVPFGFIGGHGTCAGMKAAMDEVGYEQGFPLGMATASIALLLGVLLGSALVNYVSHKGLLTSHPANKETTIDTSEQDAQSPKEQDARSPTFSSAETTNTVTTFGLAETIKSLTRRYSTSTEDKDAPSLDAPSAGKKITADDHMDTLVYHISWLAITLGAAAVVRSLLMLKMPFAGKLPLFVYALTSSLAVQKVCDKTSIPLDRTTVTRIVNTAQDCIIVSGIALLSLNEVANAGVILIIGMVAALAWGAFAFFILAPLFLKDYWVERALVEFGASVGNTATGLLLLRMADPEGKTPVIKHFGIKQLVACPLIGGGLYDALAVPLVSAGPFVYLGTCAGLLVFFSMASCVNLRFSGELREAA